MTRVAITTDQIERAAPPFVEVGLVPVHLPCIRVEAAGASSLEAARASASQADLILITSPRTVGLLWPRRDMPPVDVVAVGRVTAAMVADAGGRVVASGTSGLSGLVTSAGAELGGRRVVLIGAAATDPGGMARLEEVVLELEQHLVYRVVPVPPVQTQVDAVAFASPSAVRGWRLSRSLDGLVLGVIGGTTGDAVSLDRTPDVIAPVPSFPALAREMSSFLEVRV